jgi:hypothetical protein
VRISTPFYYWLFHVHFAFRIFSTGGNLPPVEFLFFQRTHSIRKRRVAVFHHNDEGMGREIAQVFAVEGFEGGETCGGVGEGFAEGIGFVFVFAGEGV